MKGTWIIIIIGILFLSIIGFSIYATRLAIKSESNMNNVNNNIKITSSAFKDAEIIPSKYTCDGENISPPLTFENIPEGTKSLSLLMDDPDVPKELRPDGVFDHWTLFNIPAEIMKIGEGESIGTPGANGRGENKYTGPCPPTEYEPTEHRYFFKLYALDSELSLEQGASKQEVLEAMEGHVISMGELMGRYDRK